MSLRLSCDRLARNTLQEVGEARLSSFLSVSHFLFSPILYIHEPDYRLLTIERLGIDIVHADLTDGGLLSNFFRETL